MSSKAGSAKALNRADLLRTLLVVGEANLETSAELSGFNAPPKKQITIKTPDIDLPPKRTSPSKQASSPTLPEPSSKPQTYYRVIELDMSEKAPALSGGAVAKPQWYVDTPPLDPDSIKPLAVKPPAKQALVAWEKLWPVLKEMFSESKQTRQADIPRLVASLANGETLTTVPKKVRQQWTANLQVLVDRAERTRLFNQDYTQLITQLSKLRGSNGLEVQQIKNKPGGRVRIRKGKNTEVKEWHVPNASTTLLVLSDLGLLDESETALKAWIKLGRQCQRSGCRVVVLLPLPKRYLRPELIGLFECICLHRSSALQRVHYSRPKSEKEPSALEEDAQTSAKALLAWLSPAVRVEPGLLRAVRHLLPIQTTDVGAEIAAWHHEDVVRSPIGFHFHPHVIEAYRQAFERQAKADPALAKKVGRCILHHHRHVFPSQRYEELLILDGLMKGDLASQDKAQVEEARQHLQQLFKASLEQRSEIPGLAGYIPHYSDRQHDALHESSGNEFLQAIAIMREQSKDQQGGVAIPQGWDLDTVMAFLNHQEETIRDFVMYQRQADQLEISTRDLFDSGLNGFQRGTPLVNFRVSSQYLLHQSKSQSGKIERTLLSVEGEQVQNLSLPDEDVQELNFAGQRVVLERFKKPAWAIGVGVDSQGLYAETQNKVGDIYRWYWNPPNYSLRETLNVSSNERQSHLKLYRGFWYPQRLESPRVIPSPSWADSCIRDRYGLLARVTLNGVEQWFRWIEPTTFQMGSPEAEEGRYDRETQHRVTLTQGYWLAETTCTQALWQAVMKENPSRFEGENNPVERVSWEDVKKFITQANASNTQLNLKLPTEAEWENACRAETTGAFNFEGELSLEKVNYRGTWDYESEFGEGAPKQTTDVKAHSPNRWGLYEMHGNVLEWCEDWFESFTNETTTDPTGPDKGGHRVLRGGSWAGNGRHCRSAYRYYSVPARRFYDIGFRLSHGHDNPPVRAAVRAGQHSSGTHTQAGGAQLKDELRATTSENAPKS